MTDTPNTPEPAKPEHDADTAAVVDAAGTEQPSVAPAAPQPTAEQPTAQQPTAQQP
ncbi:MAG: hypothetical protein JF618_08475, partial [Leifsonia sp.]|nr:hypothetical protein [Leifsonia sp.]